MPKMVVTAVMTMTNNKKQRPMNYSKQSQTKPNLSVSDRLVRLWRFLRLATNDQRLSTLVVMMPLRRRHRGGEQVNSGAGEQWKKISEQKAAQAN
jgi:hypothetical protein